MNQFTFGIAVFWHARGKAAALRQPCGRVVYAHGDLSGYSVFEEAYHWGLRAGGLTAAALHKK